MENPQNMEEREKLQRVLRYLQIIQFLLFLAGQSLLFTTNDCQESAPTIWYYCLVIIIFVYISLTLPFLIVLAICICLPCVLIIFRFFAEPEGADNEAIKKLPTKIFHATVKIPDSSDDNGSPKLQTGTNDTDNGKDNELSVFFLFFFCFFLLLFKLLHFEVVSLGIVRTVALILMIACFFFCAHVTFIFVLFISIVCLLW